MASGLMAVGATLGIAGSNVLQGALDQREYTSEQPGCEIFVQQDDTITKIQVRLDKAGNKAGPSDIRVFNGNTGKPRSNAEGPSLGMRPGDIALFEHVTPAACIAMEGFVTTGNDHTDQIGGVYLTTDKNS